MTTTSRRNVLGTSALVGLLILAGVDVSGDAAPTENYTLSGDLLMPRTEGDRTVASTAFASALAEAYLDLSSAIDAAQGSQLGDSHYFLTKSLAAREGNIPQPEFLDDWILSEAQFEELGGARLQLIETINGGDVFMGQELAPKSSARAQASFDCWVQSSEDGAVGDEERCRAAFEEALEAIDARVLAARQLILAAATPDLSKESYTGSLPN